MAERNMQPKSIKKNYIFNLFYQILLLIAPLVTVPYVSRILGAEAIGSYSYASSLAAYFVLFATLGSTTFGQRKISFLASDKEGRSRAFWELFLFRLVTVAVSAIIYLLIFAVILKDSILLYFILTLNIVNVAFDVSWFLQGMEEFGKTVFLSSICKIANIIFIFIFVKTVDDLTIYALISVGFVVLSNTALWIYLPKYLCRVKGINPFRDTKGILQLFIPTIAIQVYTVLDKSMIGWFTEGKLENGYYEQAEKIVKMALTVVTSLAIVMIPRIVQKHKQGDHAAVKYYIYKSYRFIWLMGIPIMLGLIAISSVLVPVFFGTGYEKCMVLIPIFSILAIFIGFSTVTGVQYFVPTNRQNVLTLTVTVGAVVNLILNLALIPFFQSIGAAISSIIAEFCVTISGFIYIKKKKLFELKPIFTCCWKYWIAGIVMFAVLMVLKYFAFPVAIWSLITLIAIGVAVYGIMLLVLRDAFVLETMKKFVGLFRRKKSSNLEGNAMKYDYLIVGAGLFGAVVAHEAVQNGKKVLVIDKRPNVAGNIYTEEIEGINVHKYGAHIFHTNDKNVWNYINQFADFNRFTNSPIANYKGDLYSLPFNMYTFNKMWNVKTPEEAAEKIESQRKEAGITEPKNLEEQAISLVGTDIYEKLIKGYTQKQWGRPCRELPAFIIQRLPVRMTFDNNYFDALYQGIPIGGYTKMIEKMLEGTEVKLNCDYLSHRAELEKLADKIIYTGPIDVYFDYRYGPLEYRSVRFETEVLDKLNYQGNAVVNYTDEETPYTRIIEHKFFEFGTQPKTVISREYSSEWKQGEEPYYPVNDEKNVALYEKYKELADKEEHVIFGGRLGEYKYYDMDKVIESALELCNKVLR